MNDGIDKWMSGQRGKGRDIHKGRLHSRQGKGQKGEGPRSINCFSLSPDSTSYVPSKIPLNTLRLESKFGLSGKFLYFLSLLLLCYIYLYIYFTPFTLLSSFLSWTLRSFHLLFFLFGATAPSGTGPPHF
jgi:hypothetical protein